MYFTQLFIPYWNFEYTVVKLRGDMGQGPASEMTHLGLNQPPVFFSDGEMAFLTSSNAIKLLALGVDCTARQDSLGFPVT